MTKRSSLQLFCNQCQKKAQQHQRVEGMKTLKFANWKESLKTLHCNLAKEKFNIVKGLKGSTHQCLQIEVIKKSNSTALGGLRINTPTFIN